jgi:hypothetical protein
VPLLYSPVECATLQLLLQAFPSPSTLGEVVPLLPSLAFLFIYTSSGECPSPTLWSSGCPTLFAMCLFFSCLFIIQFVFFSFFPGWGSICPRGYADLAQGCLLEYCMPLSSPGGLLLPSRIGIWYLLVREPSWFLHLIWSGDAMRGLGVWRCQEFFIFLVVYPARHISSIFPRFYFRKHTFCFLPLVTILESPKFFF